MHSSWTLWDYLNSISPSLANHFTPGIRAFKANDPFIEQLVIEKRKVKGEKVFTLLASECTLSWCEKNLATASLFSTEESFQVLNAEDLSSDTLAFLLALPPLIDKSLLLRFTKTPTFWKEFKNAEHIDIIEIKEVMFWESGKLLDGLCRLKAVVLPFALQQLILEEIEHTTSSFIDVLDQIKHSGINPMELTADRFRSLFESSRVDNFHLFKLVGEKKFTEFYAALLDLKEIDYLLITGIRAHLIKIADTSYQKGKKVLSKYDKDILNQTKHWSETEILSYLKVWSELDLQYRLNSDLLKLKLQDLHLKSFLIK